MNEIFRTKVVAVILSAAVVAGIAACLARQGTIDRLVSQNQLLQHQVQQAQADRQKALDKLIARESELERVRGDSLTLARLREQLKTNSLPATSPPPTGFYVGTTYVAYGTSNAVLQSFIRALMNNSADAAVKGEAIYQKTCAACHQRDGLGKQGLAPPLVGSEWVVAPGGERLVRIVLNGASGPMTVQGVEWNLPMPPWRDNFDDNSIAVVLNYIRSGLGTNKAAAITPALVGAARKNPHPGPETAAELLRF